MSLFSKLFGGGGDKGAASGRDPVEHNGFRIFAEPIKEAGGHRVAARIEKEIDGEVKTHRLIRADVCSNPDEARDLSVAKAKQMIDQEGDWLFG